MTRIKETARYKCPHLPHLWQWMRYTHTHTHTHTHGWSSGWTETKSNSEQRGKTRGFNLILTATPLGSLSLSLYVSHSIPLSASLFLSCSISPLHSSEINPSNSCTIFAIRTKTAHIHTLTHTPFSHWLLSFPKGAIDFSIRARARQREMIQEERY